MPFLVLARVISSSVSSPDPFLARAQALVLLELLDGAIDRLFGRHPRDVVGEQVQETEVIVNLVNRRIFPQHPLQLTSGFCGFSQQAIGVTQVQVGEEVVGAVADRALEQGRRLGRVAGFEQVGRELHPRLDQVGPQLDRAS